MTEQPSGRLYSVVTKHWPKIAAVLVGILGLTELILGGLTADTSVEFYLMAWAGTTGGLWFLFERAEKALSEESREKVVGWLRDSNFGGSALTSPLPSVRRPRATRSLPSHPAASTAGLFNPHSPTHRVAAQPN